VTELSPRQKIEREHRSTRTRLALAQAEVANLDHRLQGLDFALEALPPDGAAPAPAAPSPPRARAAPGSVQTAVLGVLTATDADVDGLVRLTGHKPGSILKALAALRTMAHVSGPDASGLYRRAEEAQQP
jgi:hypothetical protein